MIPYYANNKQQLGQPVYYSVNRPQRVYPDSGNTSTPNYSKKISKATTDEEKKRRALKEIDNIKFGWFHVRAILVAGVGFFTVKY